MKQVDVLEHIQACVSLAHEGSAVIQHPEHGDVIEIRMENLWFLCVQHCRMLDFFHISYKAMKSQVAYVLVN